MLAHSREIVAYPITTGKFLKITHKITLKACSWVKFFRRGARMDSLGVIASVLAQRVCLGVSKGEKGMLPRSVVTSIQQHTCLHNLTAY